jgi:hypothetical protein
MQGGGRVIVISVESGSDTPLHPPLIGFHAALQAKLHITAVLERVLRHKTIAKQCRMLYIYNRG